MDVVLTVPNENSTAYRAPRDVARTLTAAGFPVRTVVVIAADCGNTSTCNYGAEPAPPADGDHCADCGEPLDVLTRCQRVVQGDGLAFTLRFVCPEHYRNPLG